MELFKNLNRKKKAYIVLVLLMLNLLTFSRILLLTTEKNPAVYFLNVGQGDSSLITLPHNIQILIDGGPPNGKLIEELSEIMPFTDRHIEIVAMSHPQVDHFGGLIDVFEKYDVGAFIWNGGKGEAKALVTLEELINSGDTKPVVFKKGDRIRYRDYLISTISSYNSGRDINESSLVLEADIDGKKFLFTGDIDKSIEKEIAGSLNGINVLKVPHHGSKYSTSAELINAISPLVSIVEVGKNRYGHPSEETLNRLEQSGSKIFRTDINGTVKIIPGRDKLEVMTRH